LYLILKNGYCSIEDSRKIENIIRESSYGEKLTLIEMVALMLLCYHYYWCLAVRRPGIAFEVHTDMEILISFCSLTCLSLYEIKFVSPAEKRLFCSS
jgi:hypothetical protein